MKKKMIIIALVLVLVIVAVVAGVMFKGKSKDNNQKEVKESTDRVPTISVLYKNQEIGTIDGYTMEMDDSRMRDNIIPVATDLKVPIEIKAKGNNIEKISYELKDFGGENLIDSGEVKDLKKQDKKFTATYQASAIMEVGKEYSLKLVLKTDKYDEINYYSRVVVTNEDFVSKQIKFAQKFSDDTFDEEKGMKLVAYLEPNSQYASDSLGQTTIRSTLGMLIWKTFRPERTGDVKVSAKDIYIKDTGESGTYTLTYQIKAKNAQKTEETYNVAETITVWSFQGQEYVLAYDREVNQIWDCSEKNVGNSFIDLGIQKQKEVQYKESDNGQYVTYQINGDVYTMDVKSKKISTVFKLKKTTAETLNKTKAKVLSVDDKGNTSYMIYGYTPTNNHAGKNGIFIMDYNMEKGQSTEVAFIPCGKQASVLEKEIDELCYKGDGTVYIMIDSTIYYANLKTKEWGTLVENLAEGSIVVNAKGNKIAYNTDATEYSDSITIVDLSNGKKQEIKEDNKKVKVCGYTGENLVYGTGRVKETRKYARFPMKELKIVDKDLKEVKVYSKRNIILSDVQVSESVINFNRWKNNKMIGEEQILNTTEEQQAIAKSSYYMDDVKMQELALSFTNKLDANTALTINKKYTTVFDPKTEVKATFKNSNNDKYYVYAYGKLEGIYQTKKEAEKVANENFGLITNTDGTKIWTFEDYYNK